MSCFLLSGFVVAFRQPLPVYCSSSCKLFNFHAKRAGQRHPINLELHKRPNLPSQHPLPGSTDQHVDTCYDAHCSRQQRLSSCLSPVPSSQSGLCASASAPCYSPSLGASVHPLHIFTNSHENNCLPPSHLACGRSLCDSSKEHCARAGFTTMLLLHASPAIFNAIAVKK